MKPAIYTIITILCLVPLTSAQTTWWIDDDGSDTFGDGSETNPWKTLTYTLEVSGQVASGDTIRMKPGTYTGESYPIDVPGGIQITGDDTTQANWPRVGSDAGSVNPVFLLDTATDSADLDGCRLERLYFVGQDIADVDAPPAVVFRVDDNYQIIRSGVKNCYFERSEMNASSSGNPVILIEAGQTGGTVNSEVTIDSCTINATQRGGIECRPLASPAGLSSFNVVIRDCHVQISGQDTAEFGILIGGEADDEVRWEMRIIDTKVDSSGVASPGTDGIETGIDILMHATNNHLFKIIGDTSYIKHCEVHGCIGDGIRLTQDSDFASTTSNNVVLDVEMCWLHDNGGAGLRTDWNDIGADAYIQMRTHSNMVVDNGYGLVYQGFTSDISGQDCQMVNDTIAGNTSYGIAFYGSFNSAGVPAPSIENCIVWGNNGDGVQHYHDNNDWEPCAASSDMQYSNWMNLEAYSSCKEGIDHNLDVDPAFADDSNGNYKLTSSSTSVIDVGDDFAIGGLSEKDFELDSRTLDGGSGSRHVDLGADEYDSGS